MTRENIVAVIVGVMAILLLWAASAHAADQDIAKLCPDPNHRCLARDNPSFYKPPQMPQYLVGQWCETTTNFYFKAKNFCKETRPTAFVITEHALFIKRANVEAKMLCVPLSIEFGRRLRVVADCGLDDNSSAISRAEFVFEDGEMNGGPKDTVGIFVFDK